VLQFSKVTGNLDSLVVVLAMDSLTGTYCASSTDLGKTWTTETLEKLYSDGEGPSWGWIQLAAYCAPYSCKVVRIRVSEGESGADVFEFLEGMWPLDLPHWHSVLRDETGGCYVTGTCAQYVPYAGQQKSDGLERTTDGGLHWSVLTGGPTFGEIDDADFANVAVVGYGSVIYTQDVQGTGQLWKSTDGGDGRLSASALAPRLEYLHRALSVGGIDM